MIAGLHIVQHRAAFGLRLPPQIAVQCLVLRVGLHIQNRTAIILVIHARAPVILIQPCIGPHQRMSLRNIRVLI